jgi:hypothetical protein
MKPLILFLLLININAFGQDDWQKNKVRIANQDMWVDTTCYKIPAISDTMLFKGINGHRSVVTYKQKNGKYSVPFNVRKVYYYFWTANKGSNSAWGEDSRESSFTPSKEFIKSIVLEMFDKKDWKSQCNCLIVEDIIEFDSWEDFYKWHSKNGTAIPEVTNAIRLYRKGNIK